GAKACFGCRRLESGRGLACGSEINTELGKDVLNAVIQPSARRIRTLSLLSPFREKEFAQDKLSVFDIRWRDQGNRDFLLEMQRKAPWYFGKRALFYAATDYAKQLRDGEHYMTLQPVFVVCFLVESRAEEFGFKRGLAEGIDLGEERGEERGLKKG